MELFSSCQSSRRIVYQFGFGLIFMVYFCSFVEYCSWWTTDLMTKFAYLVAYLKVIGEVLSMFNMFEGFEHVQHVRQHRASKNQVPRRVCKMFTDTKLLPQYENALGLQKIYRFLLYPCKVKLKLFFVESWPCGRRIN